MKILFVCRANIGRSQMAEAIFNELVKEKHLAFSVGTQVIKDEENNEGQKIKDRDMQIVNAMKEIGLDVSDQVQNQLTPESAEKADKIIVMAEHETIPDYLKQNEKVIFWAVPNPKDVPMEFVRDVRDQIQVLVGDFIKTLD